MSRGGRWSVQHRTQHINLSFCGYAFWWLVILGVHLVACVYNIGYAKLYWGFELTLFSFLLAFNGIGMAPRNYHTIAYVYMGVAALHGVIAMVMLGGPCWARIAASLRKNKNVNLNSGQTAGTGGSTDVGDTSQSVGVSSTLSHHFIHFLSTLHHKLGSKHGILSVNGRYFHIILICRELVEVALQTAQAIRMSKYLPRILLNRFYVSVLVINCWSSVFVYSRWFWQDEARRRFAAIVCDCVLNLTTTMGVSLIIMLSYIDEYDVYNFKWQLLDDDEWYSQMLNEARVVLVMSWLDLATRVIFSLGLIATTSDMKELLQYTPVLRNKVTNVAGPSVSLTRNLGLDGPITPGTSTFRSQNNLQPVGNCTSYNSTGLRFRGQGLLQGVHYAFAGWGIVILSLHMHAAIQTPLFECTPKVYPMAGVLPSCYTVTFNCHSIGISGLMEEVKAEWDRFDRSTAVKLRIMHCPSLEVPDSFQDFGGLQDFIAYNSTIKTWGDTAAITNTRHPKLGQMSILRVNMTGGLLPLGFQSTDFPTNLAQITFCETNLRKLPDDLDSKWLSGSVITLENSNLTTIPPSLIRSQPYYLALSGNPITRLPPELFEGNIQYIFVGHSQVTTLPENVTPTTLYNLDITNTIISYFPFWVDPLVEDSLETIPLLIAGGSTYCSDLEKIMSGVTTNFSAPFQPEQSLLLMNASEANWEILQQAVDCSPPLGATQFSLDYFDTRYSLDGTG